MNRDQRKPTFALTEMEKRTLFVLALLLVIGLVAKQVLRWTDREEGVVIQGAPPVAALPDDSSSAEALPGGNASGSLAPSTSEDVPSVLHASASGESVSDTPGGGSGDQSTSDPGRWSDVSPQLQQDQVTLRVGDASAEPSSRSQRLNLNTCTASELESIPGIGQVLASRILQWRSEHGAFQRVEDLLLVEGIGEKRLATLRQHVDVQPGH
ncbi:helix-hairpin-helix domain-containing protein [bacterium]|nr:helix-hairpin-helix domain-containing protein [bacterium]